VLEPPEARRRGREADEVWRRRVVARAGLRIALGDWLRRDPASLRFIQGPTGKPSLAQIGAEPIPHFNISHSGEACVVAISEAAPVGVDVEVVRDRRHLERLARTRLAPAEALEILRRQGDERRRAFYRCWTRKEAYLKATGLGLTADLSSFAVSVGPLPALITRAEGDSGKWSLVDLDLGD